MVRLMVRPLVTMTLFTEMTEKIIKPDLRFTLVILELVWGFKNPFRQRGT